MKQSELNRNMSGSATVLDKNYLNINCVTKSGVNYIQCSTPLNAAMSANIDYPVGALPAESRPTYAIYQELRCGAGNYIRINIKTTGEITVTPLQSISATTGININFTYI